MTSVSFDLPTLRNHYTYFTINNKHIPAIYRYVVLLVFHCDRFISTNRLKSGIYYPYVAFDLVTDQLNDFCSTWTSSSKLPLLPMTINETLFYKNFYPKRDFSSSKVILCSFIDQFLQLINFLKDSQQSDKENQHQQHARFSIDVQHGSTREIDILNSEATTRYNLLRSTAFPSLKNVTRRLCFDDEKSDLSSIGGYLQLDQCIYPYVISSSDILLNVNDLRKPFQSTLNYLMPHCQQQSSDVINNYIKIVQYGIRCIKKYKYYYKNVDDKFISLYRLLLSHQSMFFVQLFDAQTILSKNLHEYYRTDFVNLLTKNISNCGYLNTQPCINGWTPHNSTIDDQTRSRLATYDEVLLFNWLLIYDNKCVRVHNQSGELVLVKQQLSIVKDKMKLVQNEHIRKRSTLLSHSPI
ncbi:unnamed protein product [Adineta ricciae]|uniref:Uncharacterized protein n=1 Tax=Adineta ricciae TaxID=249248 RepID=A0A814DKH0_ADIRI|nr:unnamed protein product [Adineta ricciae]